MNKPEALEWLAHNLKEWPISEAGMRVANYPARWIPADIMFGDTIVETVFLDPMELQFDTSTTIDFVITKADWLAAKEQKK